MTAIDYVKAGLIGFAVGYFLRRAVEWTVARLEEWRF